MTKGNTSKKQNENHGVEFVQSSAPHLFMGDRIWFETESTLNITGGNTQ